MTDENIPVEVPVEAPPQTFDSVVSHFYGEFCKMVDYLHNGLQKGAGELPILAKDTLKAHLLATFANRAMQEVGLLANSEPVKEAEKVCEEAVEECVKVGVEAAVEAVEAAL